MKRTLLAILVAMPLVGQSSRKPFNVYEATIPEMQRAMREGRITARGLVEQSLIRIAMHEDQLNAVMTVNK